MRRVEMAKLEPVYSHTVKINDKVRIDGQDLRVVDMRGAEDRSGSKILTLSTGKRYRLPPNSPLTAVRTYIEEIA